MFGKDYRADMQLEWIMTSLSSLTDMILGLQSNQYTMVKVQSEMAKRLNHIEELLERKEECTEENLKK